MYRIPRNLNLDIIVGNFLTQLRVGQFDLQFTIADVDFRIESEVNLFRNGECIGTWSGGNWPSPEFYETMNSDVVKCIIPDDRNIVICLENGIEIHLKDSSDQFECMQISIEGEQWLI